jgi:hypothetical protein
MSELLRSAPGADELAAALRPGELERLLGLPRSRPLEGVLAQRAAAARSWYGEHGRPMILARRAEIAAMRAVEVELDGGRIVAGEPLAQRLAEGGAHAALVVAVTAGAEVDRETDRCWAEGRPDEAYFLDRFAAAVVEESMRRAFAWLCRAASPGGETALPHLSPGCGGWGLEAQHTLWNWLAGQGEATALAPFEMLDSGMLRPRLSLLAVIGLARHRSTGDGEAAEACRSCDLSSCAFRRVPFQRAAA